MAKIKYTEERLKGSLRMGKLFLGLGLFFILLSFVYKDWEGISPLAIGVGEISAGIVMLFVYSYQKKKQYLSIQADEITKHGIFSKKIDLKDIIAIKEFAGDIKLKTERGEFVIDTQTIAPDSLEELKTILSRIIPQAEFKH
ncbi:hypothetical protein [Brumimicrobium mesophilum]|uniref:hypothetical protein n=1 Tax=Brumimicrobium mesophilum TaxID=392717 RepID=UPI000D1406D8|nr:hypothetical protein [Brumimicrobium mesophilum]